MTRGGGRSSKFDDFPGPAGLSLTDFLLSRADFRCRGQPLSPCCADVMRSSNMAARQFIEFVFTPGGGASSGARRSSWDRRVVAHFSPQIGQNYFLSP